MQETPYGYCHCGCGQKTRLARQSHKALGHTKDEPVWFVLGHGHVANPDRYRVDSETGCWIWQGSRQREGYGGLRVRGVYYVAHRYFYERAKGPIPDGLEIDHLCRNRACVNPDHLEAVTRAENVRRGSSTKLSEADVRAIRASTQKRRVIAEQFGVTVGYVKHLRSGRSRKSVV